MSSHVLFRLAVAVVFIASAASARAACIGNSTTFYFKGETVTRTMVVNARGCRHNFRVDPGETLRSVEIESMPHNGRILRRSAVGVTYVPKRGYRGHETYALRICGSAQGRPGCSVTLYDVTVR